MKSLLDSEWLLAIAKIPWWVLGAVATASGLVLWLNAQHTTWFPQLPPNLAMGVGVVGILSSSLVLFRLADGVGKWYHGRLGRRLSRLSDQQRDLLRSAYRMGSRHFDDPTVDRHDRWLEELEEWKYIELRSVSMVPGVPCQYSVTQKGWREVQRFEEQPRRRT